MIQFFVINEKSLPMKIMGLIVVILIIKNTGFTSVSFPIEILLSQEIDNWMKKFETVMEFLIIGNLITYT